MEIAKKLNIFALGILVIQVFYFVFKFFFKDALRDLVLGRSSVGKVYSMLAILIGLIIFAIYLVYIIHSKFAYGSLLKSSMISNLVGATISTLFWTHGIVEYIVCISRSDPKCGLSTFILFTAGLVLAGFFLLVGLILLGIGIWKDKKEPKSSQKRKSKK